MFVPKRMIFPETVIFMKDVATCHNQSFSTTRHSHASAIRVAMKISFQLHEVDSLQGVPKGMETPSLESRRYFDGIMAGSFRWVMVPWEIFHVTSGRGTFLLSTQCEDFQKFFHTFKKYSRKHDNCYIQLKYHTTLTYSVFLLCFWYHKQHLPIGSSFVAFSRAITFSQA